MTGLEIGVTAVAVLILPISLGMPIGIGMLFVLMGLLVTVSGGGKDAFNVFERLMRKLVGGLGVATVVANAVFASITGVSIASAATFFSRMLAMSGLPNMLGEILLGDFLGPYGFLLLFLVIVILLGCLIDSISIMLISLPIALPVAQQAGFDLIWFGVLSVVAVKRG